MADDNYTVLASKDKEPYKIVMYNQSRRYTEKDAMEAKTKLKKLGFNSVVVKHDSLFDILDLDTILKEETKEKR